MQGLVLSALLVGSPPRIDVEAASAPCVSEVTVRSGIEETIAAQLTGPDDRAVPTRLAVRVLGEPGSWHAEVEVVDEPFPTHARALDLEGRRCEDVLAAVVLVSALLLEEAWSRRSTLVVAAPPPAPTPAPDEPPKPPRPEPRTWSTLTELAGLFGYGDLPRFNGGVGLRFEIAAPRVLAFGFGLHVWPRAVTEEQDGVSARFSAFEGAAFLCPRAYDRRRVMVGVCGQVRAGANVAVSAGLDEGGATRARVLLDFGPRVRVRVFAPLTIGFAALAAIPLVRDRFTYDTDQGSVLLHQSWPVVPMAEVSLGFEAHPRKKSLGRHKSGAAPTSAL